jgi:hypothetical protein
MKEITYRVIHYRHDQYINLTDLIECLSAIKDFDSIDFDSGILTNCIKDVFLKLKNNITKDITNDTKTKNYN